MDSEVVVLVEGAGSFAGWPGSTHIVTKSRMTVELIPAIQGRRALQRRRRRRSDVTTSLQIAHSAHLASTMVNHEGFNSVPRRSTSVFT
jgi:hypothetical protein